MEGLLLHLNYCKFKK